MKDIPSKILMRNCTSLTGLWRKIGTSQEVQIAPPPIPLLQGRLAIHSLKTSREVKSDSREGGHRPKRNNGKKNRVKIGPDLDSEGSKTLVYVIWSE